MKVGIQAFRQGARYSAMRALAGTIPSPCWEST